MNAIETAIKMEQEAIDFYTKCADKTNNPIGKKMFLSIAEDEKYHIACAIEASHGKNFAPAETTPSQDIKTIFERNKEAMLQRVSATADELEALEMAMKMEEETIKFYKKAAAHAEESKQARLPSNLRWRVRSRSAQSPGFLALPIMAMTPVEVFFHDKEQDKPNDHKQIDVARPAIFDRSGDQV